MQKLKVYKNLQFLIKTRAENSWVENIKLY